MALSYLNADDLNDWLLWFWVLLAFRWTAEQGRPVPPLTIAWRTQSCEIPAHLRTLVTAWIPTATAITATDDDAHWTVTWRDTRWMAWRAFLQDPALSRSQRRDAARAYMIWHHTLQARQQAVMQQNPMLAIQLTRDGVVWRANLQNYDGFWDDPLPVTFAHWLQTLVPLFARIPIPEGSACAS